MRAAKGEGKGDGDDLVFGGDYVFYIQWNTFSF